MSEKILFTAKNATDAEIGTFGFFGNSPDGMRSAMSEGLPRQLLNVNVLEDNSKPGRPFGTDKRKYEYFYPTGPATLVPFSSEQIKELVNKQLTTLEGGLYNVTGYSPSAREEPSVRVAGAWVTAEELCHGFLLHGKTCGNSSLQGQHHKEEYDAVLLKLKRIALQKAMEEIDR